MAATAAAWQQLAEQDTAQCYAAAAAWSLASQLAADDKEREMPPVVFTENPHDEGGLTAQVEWLGEDAEVYVYALKSA